MPYQVALDTFHGPLDLLLYLVRKNEVDVLDVPLAGLAEQFLDFLRAAKALDVEFAGEFLVTAATLMEIKAKSLLPQKPPSAAEADEPDPRRELVTQLLEYRKYKDAAAALEAQAHAAAARQPRQQPPAPPGPDAPVPVKKAELWDLVAAFARLMRETQAAGPTAVVADDTPQQVYEEQIVAAVRAAGRLAFGDVFAPPRYRSRLIGLFLAVLELVKRRRIAADQPVAFGEVWLTPGDGPLPLTPSRE